MNDSWMIHWFTDFFYHRETFQLLKKGNGGQVGVDYLHEVLWRWAVAESLVMSSEVFQDTTAMTDMIWELRRGDATLCNALQHQGRANGMWSKPRSQAARPARRWTTQLDSALNLTLCLKHTEKIRKASAHFETFWYVWYIFHNYAQLRKILWIPAYQSELVVVNQNLPLY